MNVTVFDSVTKEKIYSGNPTPSRRAAWEAAGHIVKPGYQKGVVKLDDQGNVVPDTAKLSAEAAAATAKAHKSAERVAARDYLHALDTSTLVNGSNVDATALVTLVDNLKKLF